MSLKEETQLAILRQPALLDQEIAFDLVFVMHVSARGWILEKICRQIAESSGCSYTFVYSERNDSITTAIPRARAYFFAHYAIYAFALARHPELHGASKFVWFTHPDFGKGITIDDLVFALGQADIIFTANAKHASALNMLGISNRQIRTIYGGADTNLFRPKLRGAGKVAFVGAFYERKQPDKMLALMKAMPNVSFLLLGPSADSVENKALLWANYHRFAEMKALPNLEIVETGYEHYARHFDRIDVYVSLSQLEGGPIPLLEAFSANAVPVVTKTGFCEELVRHGENGFLVDIDAPLDVLVSCVRQALFFEDDVSIGRETRSWDAFGTNISHEMQFPLSGEFRLAFGRGEAGYRRYLREGWDTPESAGCWQFSRKAIAVLPLRRDHTLTRLALSFRSGTAFGDLPKLEVQVRLNGHLLGTTKVRQGRQCELAIDSIPPEAVRSLNRLSIEVISPPHLVEGEVARLIRIESIAGEASPVIDMRSSGRMLEGNALARRAGPTVEDRDGGPALVAEERVKDEFIPTKFVFDSPDVYFDLPAAGWHAPEATGMWSSQNEAYVVLPLSPTLPDQMVVSIRVRLYEPELSGNKSISICISDGHIDQTSQFEVNGAAWMVMEIPFTKSEFRRVLQVRFSIDNVRSPFELGTDGEDRRKLGLLLNRISIDPAPPAADAEVSFEPAKENVLEAEHRL
jgi:glycosyltransferase involved in cell wall biosynthesis